LQSGGEGGKLGGEEVGKRSPFSTWRHSRNNCRDADLNDVVVPGEGDLRACEDGRTDVDTKVLIVDSGRKKGGGMGRGWHIGAPPGRRTGVEPFRRRRGGKTGKKDIKIEKVDLLRSASLFRLRGCV